MNANSQTRGYAQEAPQPSGGEIYDQLQRLSGEVELLQARAGFLMDRLAPVSRGQSPTREEAENAVRAVPSTSVGQQLAGLSDNLHALTMRIDSALERLALP